MVIKKELRVGVRDLVGYVLRGGDLQQGFVGSRRALEGIRGHQKVQRQRPASYQAEVSLSHTHVAESFSLHISGRVDGVQAEADGVLIEEIKTTSASLERLRVIQDPTHWGQVQVYAYLYALQEDIQALTLRLTYFQLDSEELLELERPVTREELHDFFEDLLNRYLLWAQTLCVWAQKRDKALEALHFPFDKFRPGQRHMAVAIYRRIRDGHHLMIEAPTGIGKTMGSLFPAAKALGEGYVEKIFYLTARTTGRLAAQAAAETLNTRESCLKTLVLTAKEKICAFPEAACTPETCPRAQGHYDRVNTALDELFGRDLVTAEVLLACAERHQVCPFELSLDLALWVDCIVCDYNYVFDPRVRLRRFFDDGAGRFAFLVDEAHNLVDRGRDMFSASLNKKAILALRRELKATQPGLFRVLGRINAWMLKARKRCDINGDSYAETSAPEALYDHLRDFHRRSEAVLADKTASDVSETLLEQYFCVHRFLRVGEQFDEAYRTCYHRVGNDLDLRLFCLDPARQLSETLEGCRSAIFFSATLRPVEYYRHLLGLARGTAVVGLPSPFPSENFAVFVDPHVSTHYRDRERTCTTVAEGILRVVRCKGNHLVFFPSYAYLQLVYAALNELAPELEIQVQTPSMSEAAREAFLDYFQNTSTNDCIGFAVMGGIFGEGIDLVGGRLTGAVIVGVGLPGISMERDLIRDYFHARGKDGFAYAYTYPGITRVFQAAGRVIRSASDRGTVLLMDKRYATHRYQKLLPPHWQVVRLLSSDDLQRKVRDFWR